MNEPQELDVIYWTFFFVFVSLSIVELYIGIQSKRGKLARNRWIGIRTPQTMADDEAWHRAHVKAAPWSIVAGLLAAVCAGVLTLMVPERIATQSHLIAFGIAGFALSMVPSIISYAVGQSAVSGHEKR